jgi:hypothetical protein
MEAEKGPRLPGAIEKALESAPDVMAALMKEFVEKKDVDARALIRVRMKALLDFVSVDTVFPPNPAVDKTIPVGPARDAALRDPYAVQYQGGVFGGGAPAQMNQQHPAPAAVPRRADNGDILP